MTIEAMKQALEALEELNKASIGVDAVPLPGEIDTAMDALRAAIEQAEKQKPVAWMYDFLNSDNREEVIRDWMTQDYADIEREKGFNVRPLYTAPRQWVGLTDEEIKEIIGSWGETPIKGYTRKLFDQIEAKLKEKNT
jgi:hypothetical protein